MRLYIMRHGHSPSITEAHVHTDLERPLSPQGREAVRKMIHHLTDQGGKPALILHSPYKRAIQTAAEAEAILHAEIELFEPLSNTISGPQLGAEVLRRAKKTPEVLVVGHQPQLGELATHLTGTQFTLRPGGVIAVETGESPRVLWSCNPEELPTT